MEKLRDSQILTLSNVLHVTPFNTEPARITEKRKHTMPVVWYLLTISIQQKMGSASWCI